MMAVFEPAAGAVPVLAFLLIYFFMRNAEKLLPPAQRSAGRAPLVQLWPPGACASSTSCRTTCNHRRCALSSHSGCLMSAVPSE